MKAGVAAMVVAALRVAKMPKGEAGITLIITASEETGSQGAYHLAKLGDKLGKVGTLVVGEPTANYPILAHKGSLWLEARTTGVTAHGSMPEQGVNAIYKAVQVITFGRAHPQCGDHYRGPEYQLGPGSGNDWC
jgi:succinyl-diaminopimelate desuccinylase